MEKYAADKPLPVMSRQEVRAFDRWAINELGVPGAVLMENAGRSCAELIKDKLQKTSRPGICIFCGTGNNGGDGYVIARHLLNSGFKVAVMIIGDREKIKGDALINLDILQRLEVRIEQLKTDDTEVITRIRTFAAGADMLVDSIFGTGLTGRLSDEYKRLIEGINALNVPVLAVDIPSGLDCDSGKNLGAAIKASCTVTFAAVKAGFVHRETAGAYTGEIFVADLGVPVVKHRQRR